MNEQKVYLDVEESDEIGGAEEINNSKSNMAVGIKDAINKSLKPSFVINNPVGYYYS